MTITTVNLKSKLAIVRDEHGEYYVPVTVMLDENNVETTDPDKCVTFTAGPHRGQYLADSMERFTTKGANQ